MIRNDRKINTGTAGRVVMSSGSEPKDIIYNFVKLHLFVDDWFGILADTGEG